MNASVAFYSSENTDPMIRSMLFGLESPDCCLIHEPGSSTRLGTRRPKHHRTTWSMEYIEIRFCHSPGSSPGLCGPEKIGRGCVKAFVSNMERDRRGRLGQWLREQYCYNASHAATNCSRVTGVGVNVGQPPQGGGALNSEVGES